MGLLDKLVTPSVDARTAAEAAASDDARTAAL